MIDRAIFKILLPFSFSLSSFYKYAFIHYCDALNASLHFLYIMYSLLVL